MDVFFVGVRKNLNHRLERDGVAEATGELPTPGVTTEWSSRVHVSLSQFRVPSRGTDIV
jgi:hypothetical protein